MAQPKLKIHKIHRDTLTEGRNQGISFAYAKKVSDDLYEEVMVLSPCKDYINDATVGELKNKKTHVVYGFYHEPAGILKDDYIYLSTAECFHNKYKDPEPYDIEDHLPFIHAIEKDLGFELTEHIKCSPYDVLKIDKRWASQPYMASAYGLFFREGDCFCPEKETPLQHMKKYKNKFTNYCIPNYECLLEYGILEQDLTLPIKHIHNNGGIINLNVSNLLKKKEKKVSPTIPFNVILLLASYGFTPGKSTKKLSNKDLLSMPGIGPVTLAKIRKHEELATN